MSQELLLARTRDMAFCPILRFSKMYPVKTKWCMYFWKLQPYFSIFNFFFILIIKFMNFSWSDTSKLLNRLGGWTSVRKTFLLAHNLHKMEGFFLWLQMEKLSPDHKHYGKVVACCFIAQEWSMQKALGESELFNESIVPGLVWIPKNLNYERSY